MYRWLPFVCVALLCSLHGLHAQTELESRIVISGLQVPWEILWGPDNYIWMTERRGVVSRIHPETGERTELVTISEVEESGESGLLGLALHPDFSSTPEVFLAYTYRESGALLERVVRYRYNGSALVDPVSLIEGIRGTSIHDGCRLVFAPDGTLLITTGDAADQTLPQDHSSLSGKILRLNPDGSIPADNPWPGSALFSTGHRNPQGLVIAPGGIIYSSEHGPSSDDEVNIITPGRNYGWPNVYGYCDRPQEEEFCEDSAVVEPIAAWTPTLGVCGLDYYSHTAIPEWTNSLLLVALKASRLVQLVLSEDGRTVIEQKEYFTGQYGRLRDLCISPDGRVFLATSNRDGRGSPTKNDDRIIEIRAAVETAVVEHASTPALRVAPAPATVGEPVYLSVQTAGSSAAVVVVDWAGRIVYRSTIAPAGGTAQAVWHGQNSAGGPCAPGVYTAVVTIGSRVATAPIVLLR